MLGNAEPIAAESSAEQAYKAVVAKEKMVKKLNHVPWRKDLKKNWLVYVLFLPVLAWLIIFHFVPIFIGIPLAFKEYDLLDGLFGSPWCGWANFEQMFTGSGAGSESFLLALRNTAVLGLMNLTVGFVCPIIFAMLVSQIRFRKYKRVCQMLSYLPNFVAAVVIVQIMQNLLASDGALTVMMHNLFGMPLQDWTNDDSAWFWIWYTAFGIWQAFGYGSITFVASISNIDGDLYEAANIDGANRWQMMWRITFPCILPMILMMWMLQIGLVFKVGYDRTQLLYNPMTNAAVCDTLFSFTMRNTINNDLGLATAASLFQSVLGTILMLSGNWLSKKVSGFSMI